MPTLSWTVSFTMLTASNSPAKACAGHEANRTRRLDQPPSPVTQIHRPASSRPGRHHSVTVGDIIQESRAPLSHYTRATSSESAPGGADKDSLHPVSAGIAAEQGVVVAVDPLAQADARQAPVIVVFREFPDHRAGQDREVARQHNLFVGRQA